MKNPFGPEPVIDVLGDEYVAKCIEHGPGDAILNLCRAARGAEGIALRYKCSDEDKDGLKDALVLAFMAGQSVVYHARQQLDETRKELVAERARRARTGRHRDSKTTDEIVLRCARACWKGNPKVRGRPYATARLIRGHVQAAQRRRRISEIDVRAIQKRLVRLAAKAA